MRFRPTGRIADELLDLGQHLRLEFSACFGNCQHVFPCRERVQRDTEIAEDFLALRVDVVEEDYETMVAITAGLAQCVDEVDFDFAVGGKILDQKHALAGKQLAFDLRAATKSFRFFAYILHRQVEAISHPGRERNSGGFSAGHRIDLFAPDIAFDRMNRKTHQGRAHVGKRHQPAGIVVDRARPAAREDERFVAHEADGTGVEVHPRGKFGDGFLVEKLVGGHVDCGPLALGRYVKAQNLLRRHAAVMRQFTGKIEQRFVAPRPANEGEADRASVDRACGDAHLRQAGDARRAGQAHDPDAEIFQLCTRDLNPRRDAGCGRQRENCARDRYLSNVLTRLQLHGAGGVGLGLCNRGGEFHAFAHPWADFWFLRDDKFAECLPGFVGLYNAERFAPGIETLGRDPPVHHLRQVVAHEFEHRPQQVGNGFFCLRESIFQYNHAFDFCGHALTIEKYWTDFTEYTRGRGEPARHVESGRHVGDAGVLDALVRWPQAVNSVERGWNAYRAAGVAAKRKVAQTGSAGSGRTC